MAVYHGTFRHLAYKIMTEGFRLYKDGEYHGRVSGPGIYVTSNLLSTGHWTDGIVIKSELKQGLRILWVEEEDDKRVLRYLKKEFGKGILAAGTDFHKCIPKNKQLKKNELIALVNYIWRKRVDEPWGKRDCSPFWGSLSFLIKHVRRHQYQAIGNRSGRCWDSDEIVVFSPSDVIPVEAYTAEVTWHMDDDPGLNAAKVELSAPLSLDELKVLSETAQREWTEWETGQWEDGE